MVSEGFDVIYIPIEIIQRAFSVVDVDAHWEENTPEHILQEKVDAFEQLDQHEVEKIKDELLNFTSEQLEEFRSRLCRSLERKVETIRIISTFGDENTFSNIPEACNFIAKFNVSLRQLKFYKFEIYIRYSNGDKLEAQYTDRSYAIGFLQSIGQ